MKIQICRISDLGPRDVDTWNSFQTSRTALRSPYFCVEFARAVDKVRRDVFVAVIEENNKTQAFFPFQRSRFGDGMPVGGPLNDMHGIISALDFSISSRALLDACGLHRWHYHYLLQEAAPCDAVQHVVDQSHAIDLSRGFEAYAQDLKNRGSSQIKEGMAKLRKIQRDFESVDFVAVDSNLSSFETLLKWKSQQYRESGKVDQFEIDWIRQLLSNVFSQDPSSNWRGVLSTLYLNGTPAAVHLGMQSQTVWNWWFPRHDPTLHRYSPGIVLRLLTAKYAAENGFERIDLGCGGPESYKPRLSNMTLNVCRGKLTRPSIVNALTNARERIEHWATKSSLRSFLRIPGRLIRRLERRRKYT